MKWIKLAWKCVELLLSSNSASCSDTSQKKAPGNKISAAAPHPGKNGTPTFAAVAAGYDKSPGKYGTSPAIGALRPPALCVDPGVSPVSGGSGPGKGDTQGKSLAHMTSVESDSSDR